MVVKWDIYIIWFVYLCYVLLIGKNKQKSCHLQKQTINFPRDQTTKELEKPSSLAKAFIVFGLSVFILHVFSDKCFQKDDEWIDEICETRSKCEGQDVNGESEYSVNISGIELANKTPEHPQNPM